MLVVHDTQVRNHFEEPILDVVISVENGEAILYVEGYHDYKTELITLILHLDVGQTNSFMMMTSGFDGFGYASSFEEIQLGETTDIFTFHEGVTIYLFETIDSPSTNYSSIEDQYFEEGTMLFLFELTRDDVYHDYQKWLLLSVIIGILGLNYLIMLSTLSDKVEASSNEDKTKVRGIVFFGSIVQLYIFYEYIVNIPRFSFLDNFTSTPIISLTFVIGLLFISLLKIKYPLIDKKEFLILLFIYYTGLPIVFGIILLDVVITILILFILSVPLIFYVYVVRKIVQNLFSSDSKGHYTHFIISQFIIYYLVNYSPKIINLQFPYGLLFLVSLTYAIMSFLLLIMSIPDTHIGFNFIFTLLTLMLLHLVFYSLLSTFLGLTILPLLIG